MKEQFEKNIAVITTISVFLVYVIDIYRKYASELEINVSMKTVLYYSVIPAMYILIYVLFQLIKKQKIERGYLNYINKLALINFTVIGFFILVLISQEFWHSIGLLKPFIYLTMIPLFIFTLIIFFSLFFTWIFQIVKN
ncbi:MAG: hypothetical protein U9O94_09995 [Nanoarchaeota archaeon]|nr:hypothetical protein [Nanoarchaeota archaeon]